MPHAHDLTGGRAVATWRPGTAVPALGGGDVHLWLVELDGRTDADAGLRAPLSPPERARADAYHLSVHGRRFAAGRAALREILGAYLDRDPGAIELVEGPNGKPEVTGGDGLRFNVSHCEGVALCAVSRCDVGVDLELVDRARRPRWRAVAARFFHQDELEALAAAAGEAGWTEFLRIWTLKEACLKAAGFGLVANPRSFSVAEVLAGLADTASLGGRDWRCAELRPAAGAVSALAAAPASAFSRAPRSRS